MIIQCTPAMAEAVKVIFTHERIPHSCGVGPRCYVIEVEAKDEAKAAKALEQWSNAVQLLNRHVQKVRS